MDKDDIRDSALAGRRGAQGADAGFDIVYVYAGMGYLP